MNQSFSELFKMISSISNTLKSYIENSSNINIIKDKKNLKKATNYTEELINELREKSKEYDKIFEYVLEKMQNILSEKEYKIFTKNLKHARNSRKILRLIRKIEKLD